VNENSQSESIARFVSRTKDDPSFIGYSLRAFAEAHKWEEAQVASFLGCTQESLSRLAMCCRPCAAEESYRQDLKQIALFVECDLLRLQQLLRETPGVMVVQEDTPSVLDDATPPATPGLPLPVDPPLDTPTIPWLHLAIGGLSLATVSLLVVVSVVFWGLRSPANHKGDKLSMVAASPTVVESPAAGDRISLVRPPEQVGTVFCTSKDAVWVGGKKHEAGQLLTGGTYLNLVAGSAEISMACGADVVLQAPCRVVLLDERLVQLESGKLTAQVAKWTKGFVVETHGLKVTDLGTRFAVSAESPGAAEAHVLDGSVLAKPLRAGKPHESSVLLKSGEAIRVNTREGKVDRFAAERGRFVDKFDNARPYRPIELLNTGRGLMIGDEDMRWRITAGGGLGGPWPKPAVVCRRHYRYIDNAPEKSQWISFRGGVHPGAPPNTLYTFETTLDLTGFDPTTVNVVAQILADNGVKAIRLNGQPVPIQPWVDNIRGQKFQTFHVVEIRNGFVQGENRLSIDVFNGFDTYRPRAATPMALRVEWQAFGGSAGVADAPPISEETLEEDVPAGSRHGAALTRMATASGRPDPRD